MNKRNINLVRDNLPITFFWKENYYRRKTHTAEHKAGIRDEDRTEYHSRTVQRWRWNMPTC
jgi:hypothetical protein